MEHLPGTALWWVERLTRKLKAKNTELTKLQKYATGDHPLPEGDQRARELFRAFQRKARTNYCGLVVSSVNERLHVEGFRTGAEGDARTDAESWRVWQENHLDADSELVHDCALTLREAYVLVGFDGQKAITSIESPFDVVVEEHPLNRRALRAALKMWTDELEDQQRAILFLPESIHYLTAPTSRDDHPKTEWTETGEDFTTPGTGRDNPIGRIPIARFVNRPQITGTGRAEFEDAIDIQDRINNCVLDRLVIAKLQTYRQRWMKGMPSEDEDGNPIDLPFVPGVDMLWTVDADPSDVEFGEFSQVDLRPLLEAARDDITAFVTLTGLPPHYVAGDLVNASADALAAAEARLVAKVKSRMRSFEESWEQVLELAALWEGRDLPADTEIIWSDPERKTDAQLADAAVKKQAAGVPWKQRMEDLHYSPPQIQRMEVDRATDSLLAPAPASQPAINATPGQ